MRLSDHLSKAAWSFADKGVFLAYGAVGIAQLAVLPAEQFAIFFFFNELYEIFFTLSDGFVLQALVKFGVDKEHEREVMAVTFVVHTVFIAVLAVGAMLLRAWLAHGFHEPRFVEVLTALPILCLLTVPRTYALKLFQMLIRTREIFFIDLAFFGTLAAMSIYRISTGTLQTAEDMIAINMSGAIAGSVVGMALAIPHIRFRWLKNVSLLKLMAPFGLFQGLAVSSNIVQQRVDAMMVKYFGSTYDYAVYGAAKRFFKVFDAARDAIGTVAYPAAARLHTQQRAGELKLLIEKMMSFTLLGLLPVVLAFELGGTTIMFHVLFGSKWDDAIPVFNILALMGLLIPFTLNLTVLTGLGKSRTIFKVVAISSLVSVVGNYLLVPPMHAMGAALAVLIAGAVTGMLATRAVQAEVPVSMKSLANGFADGYHFFKKLFVARGS